MIGNESCLEYWEYKKGEISQSFKSQPVPNEISRVVISGANEKASVFMAQGAQIRGFTRKGKEFFKLDTNHTEQIAQLHVQGMSLWSAGAYTLNCYASSNNSIQDKYYYLCDDKINEMVVTQLVPEHQESSAILACNDGSIKVISDGGKLLYSTVLDAAPMTIALVEDEESVAKAKVICYGLQNGNIGAAELGLDESIILWEVELGGRAPVQILRVALIKDKPHVVLVRDDSTIEVHKFLEGQKTIGKAEQMFSIKEKEAITGIAVGNFTSAIRKEILISCFSGAIKTLVDKKHAKKLGTLTEDAINMSEAQLN